MMLSLRDLASPIKLLVMDVRLRNSALLLHPILLTTKVISPLFINLNTIHSGKIEPIILLTPIALHDNDWIEGATDALGVNGGEV